MKLKYRLSVNVICLSFTIVAFLEQYVYYVETIVLLYSNNRCNLKNNGSIVFLTIVLLYLVYKEIFYNHSVFEWASKDNLTDEISTSI